MKRVIVLAMLLMTGALSLAVTASQQPAARAAARPAAPKVVGQRVPRSNVQFESTVSSSRRCSGGSCAL
jgi:hypothetical protein